LPRAFFLEVAHLILLHSGNSTAAGMLIATSVQRWLKRFINEHRESKGKKNGKGIGNSLDGKSGVSAADFDDNVGGRPEPA
jgi:hypothetical protein